MKPVDQEFLRGNPDNIPGDCVRACIATILDLDRAAVPHFVHERGTEWAFAVEDWCEERDIEFIRLQGAMCFSFPVIWAGASPREGRHAVVTLDGKLTHDPHPSRLGLADLADSTYLLLPRRVDWPAYLAAA